MKRTYKKLGNSSFGRTKVYLHEKHLDSSVEEDDTTYKVKKTILKRIRYSYGKYHNPLEKIAKSMHGVELDDALRHLHSKLPKHYRFKEYIPNFKVGKWSRGNYTELQHMPSYKSFIDVIDGKIYVEKKRRVWRSKLKVYEPYILNDLELNSLVGLFHNHIIKVSYSFYIQPWLSDYRHRIFLEIIYKYNSGLQQVINNLYGTRSRYNHRKEYVESNGIDDYLNFIDDIKDLSKNPSKKNSFIKKYGLRMWYTVHKITLKQ